MANEQTTGAQHPEHPVHTEHNFNEIGELAAGLDALDTAKDEAGTGRGWRVLQGFAPLSAVALLLLVWQIVVWLQLQPTWVIPSPSDVWLALVDRATNPNPNLNLWLSAGNSLRKGVEGFLIALAIGLPLGVALGLNKWLRLIVRPILTGLQQLPSVAWVPAAIIWFGLSDATIFAVVLLGATPSIANGLISGIDQIPTLYLRAGKVLGAKGFVYIRDILLPASWPGFLAGLEQGWAFAWRSLMAAELIAINPALGAGLGQMLDNARQLGDMPGVIGAIIVILTVGVLVERLVFAPLRQRTLKNRGLLR
jgi:NitT/TauT family transport system permease protein